LAIAWQTLLMSGWCQNLSQLYIIGHQELRLESESKPFLTLQLAVLGPLLLFVGAWWRPGAQVFVPFALLVILSTWLEYLRAVLRQRMMFTAYSAIELVRTGVFLAGLTPWFVDRSLVFSATSVLWLQVLSVAAAILSTGRVLRAATSFGRLRAAGALATTILAGRTRYVFGYFAVLAVFLRLDMFLLEVSDTPFQLAVYGAAFRLFGLMAMGIQTLHVVLLPAFQHAEGIAEIQAVLRQHRRLLALALPALALAVGSAGWWFPWIDGGRYPQAVDVFRVLGCTAGLGIAFSPFVNVVFRYRDYAFLCLLVTSITILSVPLGGWLIRDWHAIGAAVWVFTSSSLLNLTIYIRARCLMRTEVLAAATAASVDVPYMSRAA
jgi:O-antigen/teichoic acid export membrane protein